MNLSPTWVVLFEKQGWQAVHWSTAGDPRASDKTLMEWANRHDYVVFTHDLDFGTLLAATQAERPSVIQIRVQDVMPNNLGNRMVKLLREFEPMLEAGALIIVDEIRARVRILPIT